MAASNQRPWRNQKPGKRPSEWQLRQWRTKARKLAKEAGAFTSCDLCKRPIAREGRYGRVLLRHPLAWRSRARVRVICHSCHMVLVTLIEDLEAAGARDHLPPEDFELPDDVASRTAPERADDNANP